MIRMSTRGRYGARAVFELARNFDNGRLTVKGIADRTGIPMKYLEQIFFVMKEANFIHSARGPAGGYKLAVTPEDLTLLQVLETLEGSFGYVKCAKDPSSCEKVGACVFHKVWKELSATTERLLSGITYADLMKEAEPTIFQEMQEPMLQLIKSDNTETVAEVMPASLA